VNERALIPAVLVLACMAHAPTHGQSYPVKPIRVVITGGPGSATDIRMRWIAPKLSAALGQPIVIDNRPGAGGTIASEIAAKSTPDGYTLVIVHQGTLALNPYIYPRLGYDPLASFAPITRLGTAPLVLAVHTSVPANSVAELVQLAKQKPRQLNYGSPGQGSPPHVATELFNRMAQIQVVHVPYKGGGPTLLDLIGGRLAYTIDSAAVQMPSARAGKIRALGVTSAQRSPGLAELRTIAESGLPGYEYTPWQGIAAPAGTRREIIDRLHAEIAKIMGTPEARQWFLEIGGEPTTDTPEAFLAYIKAEHARWGPIIRAAGIKAE
jgi:tripartite-type tricarboxylate transporter receptor subunit TctC